MQLVHITELPFEVCEERVTKCTREKILCLNDQKIPIADSNREDVQYVHVFRLEAEQCWKEMSILMGIANRSKSAVGILQLANARTDVSRSNM